MLARYLEEPSDPDCMPEAFHRPTETGIRPSDIAKEALRLYPPSRRVHREFDGELVRADIEACHRSKLLSGNGPLVFYPERWQSICPDKRVERFGDVSTEEDHGNTAKDNADTRALKLSEQDLGFMPFATHCTADTKETKAFAMKMIVLLVAVLCGGLGEEWMAADTSSLPERHVPLESDRKAYRDLCLTKV